MSSKPLAEDRGQYQLHPANLEIMAKAAKEMIDRLDFSDESYATLVYLPQIGEEYITAERWYMRIDWRTSARPGDDLPANRLVAKPEHFQDRSDALDETDVPSRNLGEWIYQAVENLESRGFALSTDLKYVIQFRVLEIPLARHARAVRLLPYEERDEDGQADEEGADKKVDVENEDGRANEEGADKKVEGENEDGQADEEDADKKVDVENEDEDENAIFEKSLTDSVWFFDRHDLGPEGPPQDNVETDSLTDAEGPSDNLSSKPSMSNDEPPKSLQDLDKLFDYDDLWLGKLPHLGKPPQNDEDTDKFDSDRTMSLSENVPEPYQDPAFFFDHDDLEINENFATNCAMSWIPYDELPVDTQKTRFLTVTGEPPSLVCIHHVFSPE
ncbi:MAG: hypothetical protein M1837_006777 [Sclerophora amabilis]|nr:MAG: hypothetical protein M1837_006777 [Sclerophora amabilis]